MSFFETVLAQPGLVSYWVIWLTAITTLAWIVFAFRRAHWPDAAVVFAANLAVTISMQWLFQTRGYGPVLSLPHLVFWLPLLAYIAWRLRCRAFAGIYRLVAWLLAVSLAVSLVLDLREAARLWPTGG